MQIAAEDLASQPRPPSATGWRRHGLVNAPSALASRTPRVRERKGAEVPARKLSRPRRDAFSFAAVSDGFPLSSVSGRVRWTARRRRRQGGSSWQEAGGRCVICGYGRYPGALQFHHLDPQGEVVRPRSECGMSRAIDKGSRRGREMRPAVCKLPCRSWWAGIATIARRRPCRYTSAGRSPIHRSGVIQSAECSAVNRVVVGSSPTPRVERQSNGASPPRPTRSA